MLRTPLFSFKSNDRISCLLRTDLRFHPEKPQCPVPSFCDCNPVSHSRCATSPPPKQLQVIRSSSPFNLPNLCQDCYQRAKQLLAVCPSGLSCTGRLHWVFPSMTDSEYPTSYWISFWWLYCFIREIGTSIWKMSVVESHY